MRNDCIKASEEVLNCLQSLEVFEVSESIRFSQTDQDRLQEATHKILNKYTSEIQNRVYQEFFDFGPLNFLLSTTEITEILINGPHEIWLEIKGQLFRHDDSFFSELTFQNIIHRLCQKAGIFATQEVPYCEGAWGEYRLTLLRPELTGSSSHLSLRRHPHSAWTLQKLEAQSWCTTDESNLLKNLIQSRANFMVVGPTGSGKTSVLNSLLNLIPVNERTILIEDTSELQLPNKVSLKLLTRDDSQKILSPITQTDLVKRSLRLRPDRLVMGEIRGSEAKDFLMTLATGHTGCFGTLHAKTAAQALLRLEMLIQMGAPQWSLLAIRRLIQLSLEYVVVIEKSMSGQRKLEGIYRISSLEDHGFLLEKVDFQFNFKNNLF